MKEKEPKVLTTACCDVLMKLNLDWMSYHENGNKVLVMPNILIEGVRYRVNYCPSCGSYIRSIELIKP